MTHESAVSAIAMAPTSAVSGAPASGEADISCIRCGYSLIGLDPRRPCPECGLLAGLSHLDGRELRHNRPRWLRRLSAGAALTAAGILLTPLVAVGTGALFVWDAARTWGGPIQFDPWTLELYGTLPEFVVAAAVTLLSPCLVLLGVWLLSSPSGRAAIEGEIKRRYTARAAALLPLVATCVVALMALKRLPLGVSYEQWFVAALPAVAAPLPHIVARHLRYLAQRAPAPLLAVDSPVVGTVLGVCLLGPLAIAVSATLTKDLFARGIVGTVMLGFVVVWMAVSVWAVIWSIYLLIRYAVAFARTARQARDITREFDASRHPEVVAYDPTP